MSIVELPFRLLATCCPVKGLTFWSLSDNVMFLDQERFALRCQCLGRAPAGYHWTVDILSVSNGNKGSTFSPGPLFLFLTPPHPPQGLPSVAQLMSTRRSNILLSKTQECQHLDKFFQEKACAVYSIYPSWAGQQFWRRSFSR